MLSNGKRFEERKKKHTTISNLDSTEKIGSIGNIRLDDGVLLTLATLELLLLGLALRDKLHKQIFKVLVSWTSCGANRSPKTILSIN